VVKQPTQAFYRGDPFSTSPNTSGRYRDERALAEAPMPAAGPGLCRRDRGQYGSSRWSVSGATTRRWIRWASRISQSCGCSVGAGAIPLSAVRVPATPHLSLPGGRSAGARVWSRSLVISGTCCAATASKYSERSDAVVSRCRKLRRTNSTVCSGIQLCQPVVGRMLIVRTKGGNEPSSTERNEL
jgi:hypothetical protein